MDNILIFRVYIGYRGFFLLLKKSKTQILQKEGQRF